MKQKIILHIGHGKTGTSAIQSMLARNHELLKSHGILYPEHASFGHARLGYVTSGNLDPEKNWFEGQVINIARKNPDYSTYIFSSEYLFWHMGAFLETQAAYSDDYDFELVLFVRNPLDFLVSTYHQAVKRGWFSGVAEFARRETVPIRAAALVEQLEARDLRFRLFNYSAIRRDLVRRFFTHLNLWDIIGQGAAPTVGTVNRSLTAAELGFIRYVNQIFGARYGTLISDALVNQLADIPSDVVLIDDATRREFCAKNEAAVRYLNAHLPPSEQLVLDLAESVLLREGEDALSSEQVRVIAKVFPHHLTEADSAVLCELALKYEHGEPLNKEDAITLMEYARKARPHDPIIAKKLEEWRQAGKVPVKPVAHPTLA